MGVKLKKVTKRYGSVIAVNEISLTIKDKEFVVLLGPSGCGKTTTLRCVAGLEIQDEGDIYIGDTLVNDISPKDRDIAMVFQNYAVYPHMTVFDNLAFPLKMRKRPRSEIEKKVKEVAELLNIPHLLERKPGQMSGGEMQRTALGRAIVREPKVFLMDEPLSNLDAKLRIHMRAELKRLRRELGVTTIYVTHDQAEAMVMGDRIAVMDRGMVQQVDTSEKVYFKPANVFVAGFLGSPPTNVIDCTFEEKKNVPYLDTGVFKLKVLNEISDLIKREATSSELVLGVRPEDVSISKEKRTLNSFPAEVYVTEPLGSTMIVDLKVDNYLFKASVAYDFKVEIGEKVWLTFDETKIHIFDKKTGNAIF